MLNSRRRRVRRSQALKIAYGPEFCELSFSDLVSTTVSYVRTEARSSDAGGGSLFGDATSANVSGLEATYTFSELVL